MTSDLKDMYNDLLVYGITEETMKSDRDTIIHGMYAEDFLAHVGIEIPEDPDDEWFEAADDVIAHFGVKGMRWGRLRPRGPNGLVIKTAAPTIDRTKIAGSRGKTNSNSKSAKTMTNEELNSAIKRIQLEQQYKQLTAPSKNVMLSEVKKIAGNALRQNAQSYANQYLGLGVGLLLKKAGVPNAQDIAERARKEREAANEKKD